METAQFEREVLANISTEVEKRFAQIDDLAHGWEHVRRVYTLALRIAEQENANRFVVGMAALMHDLGRAVQGGRLGVPPGALDDLLRSRPGRCALPRAS